MASATQSPAFQDDTSPPQTPTDADLTARWTRLRELLEGSDSLALVLWHESSAAFTAELSPPTARALGDAIGRCDFQQALDCLPPTLPPPAR